MAEVVDVPGDLADQAAGGQLLQGGHRLLVAAAAGRPGGVDVEGTAEHGRGGQHLPGRLAHPADPGRQQVAGPAGRQRRQLAVVADHGQVLQHQERQALGALVQQPGRPARAGATAVTSSATAAASRRPSPSRSAWPARRVSAASRRRRASAGTCSGASRPPPARAGRRAGGPGRRARPGTPRRPSAGRRGPAAPAPMHPGTTLAVPRPPPAVGGGQQDLADPLEELAPGRRPVQRARLGQAVEPRPARAAAAGPRPASAAGPRPGWRRRPGRPAGPR